MAFVVTKVTATDTQVQLDPAPVPAEELHVTVYDQPIWIGPTGVTVANGYRLDPRKAPFRVPSVTPAGGLFAIAVRGKPARVEVFRGQP